ncbi:hypothetical protein ABIC55_003454 [Sporosarcina psychrophila]|uniref:Uncharacterized protein n=1 Tax=Sporosarcina psychrophila TaxID=1476 RepID=A0ABV2KBS6_SPOPS
MISSQSSWLLEPVPGLLDGIQPLERNDEMKKLNVYFFGEEQIHPSDARWFYGTLSGASLLTLVLWVVTL